MQWAGQMSLGKNHGIQGATGRDRGHKEGKERRKESAGLAGGSYQGAQMETIAEEKKKKHFYSLQESGWDTDSGIMSSDTTKQHPAYWKCIWRLSLRKHKDTIRTNSPFWDPPLFTVSRNSGAHPTGVILHHKRVSSVLNRDTKHQEVLTQTHTVLFLLESPKYKRKSHQVIKQVNSLEMINHKTLCGKWDVPISFTSVCNKEKKKSILLIVKEKKFIDRWPS